MGELEANLALATAAVAGAVRDGAEVVVLPELVTSGYCFDSLDEAWSTAITPDHPAFAEWAAHGAVVVAGFAEDGGDGRLYNSALLLDGERRTVYRKVHLWDTEQLWFTPGDALPAVVDTAAGRIGLMVCYDLEFPEFTRSAALRGAELLTVPTNWPRRMHPPDLPPPEVVVAMAAAQGNRMAIACCDRRGTERGQEWMQATTIVGPDGWPVATAGAGGVAVADVDLAATRDKRLSSRNDLFGDRRTELYRSIGPGPR